MRSDLNTDVLSQKLANSGLRSTPQREVVYNVLLQKRDHPTADEVYARVRTEMPTISLATVYNCLEALVQCEVVRAVNFERGPTRYCPNLKPHAHFHDEKSGETYDVDLTPSLLDQVRAVLPPGYDASSVEIIFRGAVKPSAPAAIPRTESAAMPIRANVGAA
ncbi:MAG TPA: transcriptional repressor [Opitutaceae bacterium]|nr:transcriptional repressor [Opitutaceae bacterium]